MVRTFDLTTMDDPRDGVHQAVQALVEGACVALPLADGLTPTLLATVEHPGASEPDEVAGSTRPVSLLFDGFDYAADFLPQLNATQARLLLRADPGAIVFRVPRESDSPLDELPQSIREKVASPTSLCIRLTGNPITDAVISLLPAPLIAGPPSLMPEVAVDLIDGSEPRPAPSVVAFEDGRTKLEQVGAVDAAGLRHLQGLLVVFVCTGNTCRSPMAEVLLKTRLCRELGVELDELIDQGVRVVSAGVAAQAGAPASAEAVRAVQQHGGDLSDHRSTPASAQLLQGADAIFTMTQGHRAAILSQLPELSESVQPLVPGGRDVDDPIGGSIGVYQRCMAQINDAIEARLPDLLAQIEELRQGSSTGSDD